MASFSIVTRCARSGRRAARPTADAALAARRLKPRTDFPGRFRRVVRFCWEKSRISAGAGHSSIQRESEGLAMRIRSLRGLWLAALLGVSTSGASPGAAGAASLLADAVQLGGKPGA